MRFFEDKNTASVIIDIRFVFLSEAYYIMHLWQNVR